MSQKIGYKKNWYKEWFGEDYLTVYQHRDDNDAFNLVKLIRKNIDINPDCRLLDLACGNGRHAYILSDYTSKIIGLDLSAHLLNEAQKKKIQQKSPSFVRGDMRYFPFNIKFDFIFSLFTSFGYFDTDAEHVQVAREISACLKKGGSFVIDYLNPNFVKINLKANGERKIGNIKILEKRWIENRRIYKEIQIDRHDIQKKFMESVRIFEKNELILLLESVGIKCSKIYGDYDGNKYSDSSKRMIIFAKKE